MIGLLWLRDTVSMSLTQKLTCCILPKKCHITPPPSHNGHLSTMVNFFCPRPRWSFWRGSTKHSNCFKTHAARSNKFNGCLNTLKQVNLLMKWDWLLVSGKNYAAKGKYILLTALGHHKWNGYERFTPWKTFKFHYRWTVNLFLICLCRLIFHNRTLT